MIILKHGKKPEPKRWKFQCKLCGCEWIADETEAECWTTWNDDQMITVRHATCNCPTCLRATSDLCEVEPDEYNKLVKQYNKELDELKIWKH